MKKISSYITPLIAFIAGQHSSIKALNIETEELCNLLLSSRSTLDQAEKVKMLFRLAQEGFDLHSCIRLVNERFSQTPQTDF